MSGILIVSLDFELFWGVQDSKSFADYGENIIGGRKAIPQLLKVFVNYGVHATWATVGMIFARNEKEAMQFFPKQSDWPSYKQKSRSTYQCYSSGILNSIPSECFYGADVIEAISQTQGQEIGTHTFSHYYCREQGQTVEQFRADMIAAKKIAHANNYELSSVVLPRNQCESEYISVLSELGFKAYRDEENDWIHKKVKIRPVMRLLRLFDVYLPITGMGGYIPKKEEGIWNLTGSRMYKPYLRKLWFLEKLKLYRIKSQMRHAAKKGLVFHLWWHPHNVGIKTEYHLRQLKELFSYYKYLNQKYGMQSMNMNEAVRTLESAGK